MDIRGGDGNHDAVVVMIPKEHVLICRDELIKVAQSRQTVVIGDLYDTLATRIELEPRVGPDTTMCDWMVWMYGLLKLVCDDCHQRGEPLLPSLVMLSTGSVW